ncbi:TPA: hypothetical protein ACOEHG_004839 [Enterobacter ludwigii]
MSNNLELQTQILNFLADKTRPIGRKNWELILGMAPDDEEKIPLVLSQLEKKGLLISGVEFSLDGTAQISIDAIEITGAGLRHIGH